MNHPPLPTVAALDLPRYLGTWYEIDRLPMRHEPEDATDVSAHYTLEDDGGIRVRNRCLHDGELQEAIGQARPIDASNSRLEVSFLPEGLRWIPFTKGDYWVILVDAGYANALVGSPDRKYLWLLAREPHMDETTRQHYIGYARQQGFDVERLIHTPHTGHPTA
ncbi:MAG: lipocalin family protein [Stenotrophomonas nitritireducens]|uniref:lipocalin family protein n=1 Tax=Stenotrophomonas nitritireducens TaxID=83617 RepID=UPI001ACF910B|nr:lipocalin family protein [Stenotrophomonas nitritireducens]MBN8791584.1 lipocalin family protein [Stenotrophomonas nitritireducens]MBN8795522.1 lipocalin family protein [Stenotrophomonas nitritireducens]